MAHEKTATFLGTFQHLFTVCFTQFAPSTLSKQQENRAISAQTQGLEPATSLQTKLP